MSRIPILSPLVPKSDGRSVQTEPKRVDPFYQSDGHKRFRDAVLARAGYRCEWIENGQRCTKAAPAHRLFADHVDERKDGGDQLDPANGECLCGQHHSIKTARARAQRFGLKG
ncbi:HNH endonuclease signature motif containing protein [Bradyrhizobium sp. SZCCHNR1020]|uniref:HNH endonuclease n=1 Tax=Bradyrhizobium sp. SZCCHNR1020 TaxID=3057343 RepID=UPI0029170826|nr:HNH endonuclease signature motif containing protein [Bradyrhizobium sp. SZCCHNR1020]